MQGGKALADTILGPGVKEPVQQAIIPCVEANLGRCLVLAITAPEVSVLMFIQGGWVIAGGMAGGGGIRTGDIRLGRGPLCDDVFVAGCTRYGGIGVSGGTG